MDIPIAKGSAEDKKRLARLIPGGAATESSDMPELKSWSINKAVGTKEGLKKVIAANENIQPRWRDLLNAEIDEAVTEFIELHCHYFRDGKTGKATLHLTVAPSNVST